MRWLSPFRLTAPGETPMNRGTEMILPIWVRVWGATKNPMFQFKRVR